MVVSRQVWQQVQWLEVQALALKRKTARTCHIQAVQTLE